MKIYKFKEKANIIGERVRLARQQLNISQTVLAARLQTEGITIEQKAISRIEKQDRVVADYELFYLAKVLHVDVQWLLTGEEK